MDIEKLIAQLRDADSRHKVEQQLREEGVLDQLQQNALAHTTGQFGTIPDQQWATAMLMIEAASIMAHKALTKHMEVPTDASTSAAKAMKSARVLFLHKLVDGRAQEAISTLAKEEGLI